MPWSPHKGKELQAVHNITWDETDTPHLLWLQTCMQAPPSTMTWREYTKNVTRRVTSFAYWSSAAFLYIISIVWRQGASTWIPRTSMEPRLLCYVALVERWLIWHWNIYSCLCVCSLRRLQGNVLPFLLDHMGSAVGFTLHPFVVSDTYLSLFRRQCMCVCLHACMYVGRYVAVHACMCVCACHKGCLLDIVHLDVSASIHTYVLTETRGNTRMLPSPDVTINVPNASLSMHLESWRDM